MLRSALGFLALLALSAPALARPPQLLAPSGSWLPLKASASCKLSRSFSEGKNRTVVVLERMSPGGKINLMVFGPGLRSGPAAWGAQFSFLPNSGRVFKDGLSARTARGDTAIQWALVDFAPDPVLDREPRRAAEILAILAQGREAEATAASQITGISIAEPGGNRLVLQTGAMDHAHAMLEDCTRGQLRSWGLDPADQDRIVLGARSDRNPAEYISEHDYPVLAARYGGEAIITARLIVGADGKVSNCTTITDFAEPEMVELVCRNLSKATFKPAMLADGTNVPDFVMLRFQFGMAP